MTFTERTWELAQSGTTCYTSVASEEEARNLQNELVKHGYAYSWGRKDRFRIDTTSYTGIVVHAPSDFLRDAGATIHYQGITGLPPKENWQQDAKGFMKIEHDNPENLALYIRMLLGSSWWGGAKSQGQFVRLSAQNLEKLYSNQSGRIVGHSR